MEGHSAPPFRGRKRDDNVRRTVLAKPDPEQVGGGTVLVVDDDPLVLRTFERMLAERYTVETCATARDAIPRIARGGIDVVVTDLSMPGLSGIDLLRAVRARNPHLPIIIATGSPTADSEAEAAELGAYDYLVKPIGLEQLWRTVDLAIRRGVVRQNTS